MCHGCYAYCSIANTCRCTCDIQVHAQAGHGACRHDHQCASMHPQQSMASAGQRHALQVAAAHWARTATHWSAERRQAHILTRKHKQTCNAPHTLLCLMPAGHTSCNVPLGYLVYKTWHMRGMCLFLNMRGTHPGLARYAAAELFSLRTLCVSHVTARHRQKQPSGQCWKPRTGAGRCSYTCIERDPCVAHSPGQRHARKP